jgi:hypothetical protein
MLIKVQLPCGHIEECETHNLIYDTSNIYCNICDSLKKFKFPHYDSKLIQKFNEEEKHLEQIKDSIGRLLTELENCTIRKTNLVNVLRKTIF